MTEIVGHSKQITALLQALRNGRLHHAHLFCGLAGIGKKRAALQLARHLLESDKVEKNIHPDFYGIAPEGLKIKIEVIRALKLKIFLHPLEAPAKVVVIDDAETMTDAAANALLKILEEPPADTYFFLISSKPLRLLPTIRSRCQRTDFPPLTAEQITELLCAQGVAAKEAELKAAFAGGSLRAALDFDAALFEQTRRQIAELQEKKSPSALLALSEQWSDDEELLPFLLSTLTHLWHEKMLASEPENMERRTQQWQAIQQAAADLEGYPNKQLLLENLLFTLSAS